MKNPRLFYRVILKAFALIGGGILLYVMFSSLFTSQGKTQKNKAPISVVKFDLAGLTKNGIKKVRWNNREVIILKGKDFSDTFVFFNTGDSGNCPLFYLSGTFKDTCTGTLYDRTGRDKQTKSPKVLKSPAYHVEGSVMVVGQ